MSEVRERTELITSARREAARPALCDYSYRLVAPLFEGPGLIVSAAADGDAVRVTTRDSADRTTAAGVIQAAAPG